MKNITLAGRLTRDAESRTVGSDKVTNFSVAVDDRAGREKTTLFFDCSLWGKRGEALSQYLTKGSSVTVTGDLGKREHDGETYLTVRVNDVTLQGGKQQPSSEDFRNADAGRTFGGGGGSDRSVPGRAGPPVSYDRDDDIPFVRTAHDGEV
jgi:single-strand DNA-binding protein